MTARLLTKEGDYVLIDEYEIDLEVRSMCCTGIDQYNWCDLDLYLDHHGYVDSSENRKEYYKAMNWLGFTGFES